MVKIIQFYEELNALNNSKEKKLFEKFKPNEILIVDFQINDLKESINQISLFNDIKIIKIENCEFLTNLTIYNKNKNIFELLNNKFEFEIILFAKGKLLSNSLFLKSIANFEIIQCIDNRKTTKKTIINDVLKMNQLTLKTELLSILNLKLNKNFSIIFNELNKLVILKNEIDFISKNLEKIICDYNEENIFQLLENILLNNKTKVWEIFINLKLNNYDEITILNILGTQLSKLFFCIDMLQKEEDYSKIISFLGINPYIINIYKTKFINYNIHNVLLVAKFFHKTEKNIKLQLNEKSNHFKLMIIELGELLSEQKNN